jgi:diguanylate cyclase (GGDEF)-like protein
MRWWPVTEFSYVLVAALGMWLLPSAPRGPSETVLIGLVAYLAGAMVHVPLSDGYCPGTQPAFVLLLLLAPLNVVPMLILGVKLVASVTVHARDRQWRYVPRAAGDCWHALPPVVILALFASGRARLSDWPLYLVAFTAQFGADLVINTLRAALTAPTGQWRAGLPAVTLDALMTPAGILIALEARRSPAAGAIALAGLLGMFAFASRERQGRLVNEHRALHDVLTGVANRALFDVLLESAAYRAERTGHGGGVLLADLDDFKVINDTRGHALGDEVLKAVAARLTTSTRQSDAVARLGGDEFAVLLTNEDGEPDVEYVADKLRAAFAVPLVLPGGELLTVGVSLGHARFSTTDEAASVLARADGAMYQAKPRRVRATSRPGDSDRATDPCLEALTPDAAPSVS